MPISFSIPQDVQLIHYLCPSLCPISLHIAVADIGVAMVSAEIPSKNSAHAPNLFMICMGDKITKSYAQCIILGLVLLAKRHTFAFEITENAITVSKHVKNNYRFNEYECCFASKLSAKA